MISESGLRLFKEKVTLAEYMTLLQCLKFIGECGILGAEKEASIQLIAATPFSEAEDVTLNKIRDHKLKCKMIATFEDTVKIAIAEGEKHGA